MQGEIFATAPTRVDLAGGTLDIWPLGLFYPQAMTVNVAIDRRVSARIRKRDKGVVVASKDTLVRFEAKDVPTLLSTEKPPLAAYILSALGIDGGIEVETHSRVPQGSGLGGSSSIGVAVAAAALAHLGREADRDTIGPLVRDAEVRAIRVPTGLQDHMAALCGGALAVSFAGGTVRTERLQTDLARIEECLLLVDSGNTRFSGLNNWEVFRGDIEGREGVREALQAIAEAASGIRAALLEGRYGDITALLSREWEARKSLGPGVSTPEIDQIAAIASSVGAGAKVCGAGGGGCVAVWALPGERSPGPREQFEVKIRENGFRMIPFRVEMRGLEVSEVRGKPL